MTKIIITALGIAVALSGCSTTQRQEVRRDQRDLQEQHRDVAAAMRNGTANEVREEQEDVRKAEKELRKDSKELYTPGAEETGAILQVGQQATDGLTPLPEKYRDQYADSQSSYYRSDGRMIYRIGTVDRTITGVYSMTP